MTEYELISDHGSKLLQVYKREAKITWMLSAIYIWWCHLEPEAQWAVAHSAIWLNYVQGSVVSHDVSAPFIWSVTGRRQSDDVMNKHLCVVNLSF